MTLPSLICFSLAGVLGAATVTGKIELADARKGASAAGVVVWLEPANPRGPVPAGRYILDQRNKRFLPHVMAVPVGSQVDFPNHDPIFHNAFSNFAGQPFDTGLYAPGTSHKIIFRRPGVVRVFCNIHAQMSAVIVVVPTQHFTASTANGSFRIDNVPAGVYTLRVFHERATEQTLESLERRVSLSGDADLAAIRISESGYLEVGHKNKLGRDYPPQAREGAYGVPK
jgi:plastocyanin